MRSISTRLKIIYSLWKNVQSIHHTHVWSLDGENHVLSTHVVISDETPREALVSLKKTIKDYIHQA